MSGVHDRTGIGHGWIHYERTVVLEHLRGKRNGTHLHGRLPADTVRRIGVEHADHRAQVVLRCDAVAQDGIVLAFGKVWLAAGGRQKADNEEENRACRHCQK